MIVWMAPNHVQFTPGMHLYMKWFLGPAQDRRLHVFLANVPFAPSHLPQEQSYRPGHIPTAINVPWNLAANNDGTFRENDELARIYAEAGITPDRVTVAYCRIGERSAYTWFVLHELLDWPDVRNYDGSWTEYGSLVGVPVAIGDEPGSAEGTR